MLAVNSPKLVPGGRTLPLADFTDIYPTLCELAGVPLSPRHRPDGRSFAGYVLGKPGAVPPRDWILNAYDDVRVVRNERYKLYSDGRFFDVVDDFMEEHNLADSRARGVTAARKRLQQVLDSLPPDVDPPFPLRSQSSFKLRTAERLRRERGR